MHVMTITAEECSRAYTLLNCQRRKDEGPDIVQEEEKK
jgi:hypothetical protein